MPRAELCYTCHVRRLALMQSLPYSIYNTFYKEQLEYVCAQCGGSGPIGLPPSLDSTPAQPEPAPYCLTGKQYTTQNGDTCESIANSTGVSGAALYMGNQAILPNCFDVGPGVSLCLPPACQTYFVRPSDTCVAIEGALGLDFGQLRAYNAWISIDCTNLQDATDFYGKNICISPQGGIFSGTVPAPEQPADGHTRNAVPAPEGVEVADGTTQNCGRWQVVNPSTNTCSSICMQSGITIALFLAVNPSLAKGICTLALRPHKALCVGPTYSWNSTTPASTTMARLFI